MDDFGCFDMQTRHNESPPGISPPESILHCPGPTQMANGDFEGLRFYAEPIAYLRLAGNPPPANRQTTSEEESVKQK